MALPNTIDPSTPAGSSARSLGDDQIRALKQFLVDVFGLPNNSAISNAVFTIDTDGDITAIRLEGQVIDAKYIDFDDTTNAATQIWLKDARPAYRLIGTEASAKDWRIVEDGGNINIEENTGSEASPTWAKRLVIGSTSGNLILYSGQTSVIEIDHAATANRTITLPDATDTLIGKATTDDLTNKTLTSVVALSMGGNAGVIPAAVSGVPAQHGLFRENVIKAWVTFAGADAAIDDSFNVTSVVRNSVGDYTITWNRDFGNALYCVLITAGTVAGGLGSASVISRIAGSCNIRGYNVNGTLSDPNYVFVLAIGAQ